MDYWQPYLIAFVIGLFVGIERERARDAQQTMGIRTFLLISILGAVAGGVSTLWMAALIGAFCFALIAISYFNQTRKITKESDVGLTTEFAAGLVFCLSYTAHQTPALSAIAGPVVAVILFSKSTLHQFIKTIKTSELQAALLLFLACMVVINVVPDTAIDPWGIFNPKRFGLLILVLAALEFFSYVVAKIVGEKNGLLIVGFLGGFASSTTVLLNSARQATKAPSNWQLYASSALAATLAALIELLLIVFFISPELFMHIGLQTAACVVVGGLALAVFARKKSHGSSHLELTTPLDWYGVFRLSVIFTAILSAISVAKLWLGDNASMALSFLTGLFELHGVSLANATMFVQNQLSLNYSAINIYMAIIASFVSKIFIAWLLGSRRFAQYLTLVYVVLILTIVATSWWTIELF